MQKPDELRVTFDQNPAWAEATRDMKLGDSGKAELHYTLKAKDAEGVDLINEALVPEGYEMDEGGEGEPGEMAMGSPGEAMMTPAAMMVKKKAASG